MAKGRKDIPENKVRIFRKQTGAFVVYYFQLCKGPGSENVENVYGEMYKAYHHLQERFQKKEEDLRSYLVYEESFRKWLEELQEAENWRNKWKVPFYYDYSAPENLKWILETLPAKSGFRKAYVLGSGMGIKEWIEPLADRVQGMEFYLEFATKGMEDIQEWLLEEYGMLSWVRLVEYGAFERIHLYSEEPVLIIDYSGDTAMPARGLAKGSIWIDMGAAEKKRHLIEDRAIGLEYLSLKTIWRREMSETLDTVSKFAYNTEVKID